MLKIQSTNKAALKKPPTKHNVTTADHQRQKAKTLTRIKHTPKWDKKEEATANGRGHWSKRGHRVNQPEL